MPACRMRSSSPRGATAFMAQTIQASVRPSPTVAFALSLTNATTLYDLVTAEGMGKTTVIVRGDDPPGFYSPSQPPQQKRPFAPLGGLFRF